MVGFLGIAFIGPSMVDDVKVYLERIGEGELYIRIVFENLDVVYESVCIESGNH